MLIANIFLIVITSKINKISLSLFFISLVALGIHIYLMYSYNNPLYAQVVDVNNRVRICLSHGFQEPHFCNFVGDNGFESNHLIAYAELGDRTIFMADSASWLINDDIYEKPPYDKAFFVADRIGVNTYLPNIFWLENYLNHYGFGTHEKLKWKNILIEFNQQGALYKDIHGFASDSEVMRINQAIQLTKQEHISALKFKLTIKVVKRDGNILVSESYDDRHIRTWFIKPVEPALSSRSCQSSSQYEGKRVYVEMKPITAKLPDPIIASIYSANFSNCIH